MLSRLLALIVLLALLAGGLYYWKAQPGGVEAGELEQVGQRLRDTATTAGVRAALALNRNLKPYNIAVTTQDGVVTLDGGVPLEDVKAIAGRVAASVPDVGRVVNRLRVSGSIAPARAADRTLGEALDDRSLEVQVRLAFSLQRELKGTDIVVQVFRREVALAGEVQSADERERAVEVAREVPGVAGVTDRIRVRSSPPTRTPDLKIAVERAIAANPHLAPFGLQVREEGGRLVLTGRVRTGAEKDLAGLLARDAAGGPVKNALEIKP